MRESMKNLRMDPAFAERNVNEGFSGGEKKRNEILQLELLEPEVRDPRRDRLRPRRRRAQDRRGRRQPGQGEHRPRRAADHPLHAHPALHQPDFVHVFVDGRVAEEGGPELADRLEEEGYDRFLAGAALS